MQGRIGRAGENDVTNPAPDQVRSLQGGDQTRRARGNRREARTAESEGGSNRDGSGMRPPFEKRAIEPIDRRRSKAVVKPQEFLDVPFAQPEDDSGAISFQEFRVQTGICRGLARDVEPEAVWRRLVDRKAMPTRPELSPGVFSIRAQSGRQTDSREQDPRIATRSRVQNGGHGQS